jgi:PAS domain S-box-containing protein
VTAGSEEAALPDPRVLGWLLATQNVVQALPAGRLDEFVEGALKDVPGVAGARLDVLECRTEGAGETGRGARGKEPLPVQEGSDSVQFSLETSHGHYGQLSIQLSDHSRFDPYAPFVGNYAGSLALLLENRRQREELSEALARLGRSELKYRQLFTEMAPGHAVHEIILDSDGTPWDYRFVEVNPAFERQTGLRGADIVGRTVREILPGIERSWIERYGRVALSGEPCQFEDYNHNLGRHYDVSAYRPNSGQFAVVFTDITERKLLESRLEEASEELRAVNEQLQAVNEELQAQNEELAAQQEELLSQNDELLQAREEAHRLQVQQQKMFERLQRTLLDLPREYQGITFAHLFHSATREAQVGGDFYDVFEVKDGRLGFLIGDVSGNGLEAARTAMLVRDAIRTFSRIFDHPSLILRGTNDLLIDRDLPGFVTSFLGFLDLQTGRLAFCSAGHPAPLQVTDGPMQALESFHVPLGAFPGARYQDSEAMLHRGDVLVLYTDGVTEARRGELFFGEGGLASAVDRFRSAPIEDYPALLFHEALTFSQGELADDAAVLAIRYEETR